MKTTVRQPRPVRRAVLFRLAVTTLAVSLPATGLLWTQAGLPDGPGADLTYAKCQTCHALNVVVQSAGITREMWAQSIREMEALGMKLTTAESDAILEYLATYLGPHPPTGNEVSELDPDAGPASGESLYQAHCGACHQADGKGLDPLFPPLAENAAVMQNPPYVVLVVLNGLEGEIQVAGTRYQQQMPSFAHLSDARIALIASHVVSAWGNFKDTGSDFNPVREEDVLRLRSQEMSPTQLLELRRAQ